MAETVINDLLDIAVKTADKVETDVQISEWEADEFEMKNTETSTPPVAIKSFSFS